MNERTDIHGVQISNVTMEETLSRISAMLGQEGLHTVYTPNAEIIMQAVRDPELAALLNRADLLLPDGAGVVLGSRILGTPVKEKVSGIDVARGLFLRSAGIPARFFLFGGKPGVAEQAAHRLLADYPGLRIAGFRNGYFKPEDVPEIIEEINRSGADILFVCLGAPRQEKWIEANREALRCKVALGLGGSLDIFAGTAKLAPEWMRRAGLEWLARLIREPFRWKRMLDLPRFVLLTLRVRLLGRPRGDRVP